MLEVYERFPESEDLGFFERTENDSEWIELFITTEVSKDKNRKRNLVPLAAFRPVEPEAILGKSGNDMLLKILLPVRTVRVHKQHVYSTSAVAPPNCQM